MKNIFFLVFLISNFSFAQATAPSALSSFKSLYCKDLAKETLNNCKKAQTWDELTKVLAMNITDTCNKKSSNPKKYEEYFYETQKASAARPNEKLNLRVCEEQLQMAYCKEQIQKIKGLIEGYQAGFDATQVKTKEEVKGADNFQQR